MAERTKTREREGKEREREFREGIRRSVPLDRVFDAVKRTWNPPYFFTPGRLFLFLSTSRRIHCRTHRRKVEEAKEEDERSREESENTDARKRERETETGRAKSERGRRKTDARCTLYLLRVL